MTERDPLRTHFDAFRDQSISTANPPSVEEIPRRLRRNRRRRTVAAVAAAVVLIALVMLPSWRDSGPPPIPTTSPTPSPSASPSASAVVAAPPPAGSSSTGSAASSSRAAACATSARGMPTVNGVEAQLTSDYGTTMLPRPANLFEVCPAARLAFVHVTYDWDIGRQQYVLVYNTSYALTRSQPSVRRPASNVVSSCGGVDVLIIPGRSVPQAIPRSVQDGAQPGATRTYLEKSGQLVTYLVEVYPYTTVTSKSYCVPASPPT